MVNVPSLVDFLAAMVAEHLSDPEDMAHAEVLLARVSRRDGDAILAGLDLARLVGEAGKPDAIIASIERVEAEGALVQTMQVMILCFAVTRASYEARQDASAARRRLSLRADDLYPTIAAAGSEALDFVARLVGAACQHLATIAATRVPLVRVETGVPLPSTVLAFDLHGDAGRAQSLVARNRSATPLIMPTTFEAVVD